MFDSLTGEDLYAEILLLRDQGKGVVLVEGPNDVAALESHVDIESCFLIPGWGKATVEDAIHLVDLNEVQFALAILDADWVGVHGERLGSPNVVYTDYYDLDVTIISIEDVRRRVMANFTDRDRLARYLDRTGATDPLQVAVPSAAAIGALRLASRRQHLGIVTKDLPVTEMIELNDGTANVHKLCVIAIAKTDETARVSIEELKSHVFAEINDGADALRLCSGHDLSNALATLARKRWGGHVRADVLMSAMRSALSCHDLAGTRLYKGVKEWSDDRRVPIWNCDLGG